ncbi:hypothetical protein AXFE_15830 [Acidithrix ferrooxidans]|uniref:Uncharacterized protein n=1 Tax=Acidithrix ferrooxidans TaxID=1280514 RepID=A0A0D8HI48_9ACTN|nr:hypothetical protein AXFE_15830 [Acidithrix ferrooxidans]CAG4934217.1 unnamed protein product [Acidithrix sp. C25]
MRFISTLAHLNALFEIQGNTKRPKASKLTYKAQGFKETLFPGEIVSW